MPDFTRAWDETFPPDTQPANQLGLDLRQFRTDARQRLTLSGNDADKPTNGTAAEAGLMYFALDTRRVYQWSGTAWVNITGTMFGVVQKFQLTTPLVTNVGGDGLVVTIPGGSLSPGNIIYVDAVIECLASFNANRVSVRFGANDISGALLGDPSVRQIIRSIIYILPGNAQFSSIVSLPTSIASATISYNNHTENIAADINLKTIVTVSDGSAITHKALSAVVF